MSETDGLHMYMASMPSDVSDFSMYPITASQVKVLCSYHYFKNVDMDEMVNAMGKKPMIFADSGAFSAYTQGVEIQIKDYATWLKRWSHLITTAVNLDVIRNPSASKKNQNKLEQLGCEVIPVFHTGSDFSILDELAESYPYIALGGMVGAPKLATLRWAAACMMRTKNQGTVFHGFGMTDKKNIESLPWYSVDSSSWGAGHRYGRLNVWTGRKLETCIIGDKASVYAYSKHIRALGLDPTLLADRSLYHRKYAIYVAARSYQKYEAQLRQRHGPIQCKQRTDGLHLYLVDASAEKLVYIVKGLTQ